MQVLRLLFISRRIRRGGYDIIFAVNSEGLIKAARYSTSRKTALVYLSFEIFFRDELLTDADRIEKNEEIVASQRADLIVVQDDLRADLLCTENRLDRENVEILPVAPSGYAESLKSDFLRSMFGIEEDQTIVLHAGSFADWTCAEELIESLEAWPKEFVLVIHTRYHPGREDRYIQKLQNLMNDQVYLSTKPLPADAYEKLIASADIGLVLYKSVPGSKYLQKNIENIGLASGKFAYYMKYGIPVISIGQAYYDDLLTKYGYGYNLQSMDELPGHLAKLRAAYSSFGNEAQRLYADKLNFDIHWQRLYTRLKRMTNPQ
jgi:hypothetical protein